MPTIYEKCDNNAIMLAGIIIAKHKSHEALLKYEVKIDYLFAYAENPEKGFAMKTRGQRIYGKTRKTSLKERAAGRADAEIILDGDWWKTANDKTKEALLDHELHHLSIDEDAEEKTDDLGRPKLKYRYHDIEVGWFNDVAERNGQWSMERLHASALMDSVGQLYWPDIAKKNIKA